MSMLACGCDEELDRLCDLAQTLWARLVIHELMRPDEALPLSGRSRSLRLAEAAFFTHTEARQ